MKFRITSEYGALEPVRKGAHTGIDLSMPTGTELRSLQDGVIEKVLHLKDNIGDGVLIKFEDGTTGVYGHLSNVMVEQGQKVEAGQLIGFSGNSGNSTGPHLHFGLKDANGDIVDPSPVIEQVTAMSGDKSLMDHFNNFSDWFVGKEADYVEWTAGKWFEFFLKPIGAGIKHLSIMSWDWFVLNLPEIIGYTAIGSGVFMILSAIAGKGIIKPFGVFFIAFCIAALILGGV